MEDENMDIFSRNPRVTEILQLVLDQTMTDSEMETIVLNFWNKCDTIAQEEILVEDSLEEGNQEEGNQEKSNQEEDNREETNQEEGNREEANQEGVRLKEGNQVEANQETAHQEETNREEAHQKKSNMEEVHQKEANMEEVHQKEANREEAHQEEGNRNEDHQDDDNRDDANQEEGSLEEDNQQELFCDFDILCMYMLDYVFKKNGPTMTAVSRSLYCYLKCLKLPIENRIGIITGTENEFLNALREFRNFNSAEGEDILIDALMSCLLDANFGLSLFLLKFGLLEIPTEFNEKSRKIIGKLVENFNDILHYAFKNEPEENLTPSIDLNAMLDLMRRKDANLRRSIMTFFVVLAISEYRLRLKVEFKEIQELMQHKFTSKFICIYQFFEETAEVKIKKVDVETFTVKFISPLLGVDFGTSLIQYTRCNLCSVWDTLDPRSLKDLSRSIVRQNLQKSMMFPEQVNQFQIPVDLKDFLLFHCDEIFPVLKGSDRSLFIERTLRFFIDENVLNENFRRDLEN